MCGWVWVWVQVWVWVALGAGVGVGLPEAPLPECLKGGGKFRRENSVFQNCCGISPHFFSVGAEYSPSGQANPNNTKQTHNGEVQFFDNADV